MTRQSQQPSLANRKLVEVAGKVTCNDAPVAGAIVRLYADAATLGDTRGAVVQRPGGYDWTREVTDFDGTLYSAWRKYVYENVAGIAWTQFKHDALRINPSLTSTAGRLRADQSYLLPQVADHPDIAWDRESIGHHANLRALWLDSVQGKVVGLPYREFAALFPRYNPHAGQGATPLKSKERYVLPRTVDADSYYVETLTDAKGNFRFAGMPHGEYKVEVRAEGYRRLKKALAITRKTSIELPIRPVIDDSFELESASAGGFVGVVGNEFVVKGRPLRFIGVNLRGLLYYGNANYEPLTHSRLQHREVSLDAARNMGAKVVRVFLPSNRENTQRTIELFEEVLKLAAQRELYVIPALHNFYNDNPFRLPPDEDPYYWKTHPSARYGILTGEFFRGGYKERYLPFVQAVVSAFADHPSIFAWEIGNEFKYEPGDVGDNATVFITFMHSIARAIRALDRNHLVTTGMISCRHAYLDGRWRELYGTSDFDFFTIHCYNADYGKNGKDAQYANEINKPYIIEEAGFGEAKPGDREALVGDDMNHWFGLNARGYMQWGFVATEHGENTGDGDSDSGMDRRDKRNDFQRLWNLYSRRAGELRAQTDAMSNLVQTNQNGASPTPPTAPPPVLSDFAAGTLLFAQAGLRVRRTPGYIGKNNDTDTLVILNPGDSVTALGESQMQDALKWHRVQTQSSGIGWAAQHNGAALLLANAAPVV